MTMLTARKLTVWTFVIGLVLAIVVQQVVSMGWLAHVDQDAVRMARRTRASRHIIRITVMLGLRGLILTICLPFMGWVSWKRRSWLPIGGFILVLLVETGLTGSLKMAIGRTFPYQTKRVEDMQIDVGELAFPSGHAANAAALWGYVAWYMSLQWSSTARRAMYALVVAVSVTVGVSSWLLRSHWPTDLLAGSVIGLVSLMSVTALYSACGFSPRATGQQPPSIHP